MPETLEELVKNATETFNHMGRLSKCTYCEEVIWWCQKKYGKDGPVKNIAVGQSLRLHIKECAKLPDKFKPKVRDYTKEMDERSS